MKHFATFLLLHVALLMPSICATTRAQSPAPVATRSSAPECFSEAQVSRFADGLRRGEQAMGQLGLAASVIDSLQKENLLLNRSFSQSQLASQGFQRQASKTRLLYEEQYAERRRLKRVVIRRSAGGLLGTIAGFFLGRYIAR